MQDTVPSQDMIRVRAYELYENRGRENGQDEQDWLRAEQEILKAEGEVTAVVTSRAHCSKRRAFKGCCNSATPPIYLLDGMTQSDQIAARGFCRKAGRVLGKFRLVQA